MEQSIEKMFLLNFLISKLISSFLQILDVYKRQVVDDGIATNTGKAGTH